ncbi:hypothetical protein PaeCFBP13512_23200, partial [Paenibacillus sp. CFBP13512]|uniref:hypothetical protein n=1 Tax=Paenibacillus sp. CFBP13512 TaxID=2184007 RepID=UPI00113A9924
DEVKSLNFIKYKILNPLIGQASFNNIGFKDKTIEGHINKMFQDYIVDTLEDIHLSYSIQQNDWDQVRALLLKNKSRPFFGKMHRTVKKLPNDQLKLFFNKEVLYCEIISNQIASCNYEEKVNVPFAISGQAKNMYWLDTGKMFMPLSSLAKLFFLVGAAGYIRYRSNISPLKSVDSTVDIFAYYRSMRSNEETIFLNQIALLDHKASFNNNFKNILNASSGLFEFVEFHTDIKKKATAIERFLVDPKSTYIRKAIGIYDFNLRVPVIKSFLKNIDPKSIIYNYIGDNIFERSAYDFTNSVKVANSAREEYLTSKRNKIAKINQPVQQNDLIQTKELKLLELLKSEFIRIGSTSKHKFDAERNREIISSSSNIKTILNKQWSEIVKSFELNLAKDTSSVTDEIELLNNLYKELLNIKSFYKADYDEMRSEGQPNSRTLVKYLKRDWKDIISLVQSRYTFDQSIKHPDKRGKRK